jgi:hypothetical protein
MSVRGRTTYSRPRRPAAPVATARAPEPAVARLDDPNALEADADALMAAFQLRAYSEARRRQREARSAGAAAHWDWVAGLVARRIGAPPAAGPSTRDAGLASARDRSPHPYSEVDPLDELERILAARPQPFRLQFYTVANESGPAILAETEIETADASSAIRAAADADWPPRAIGLRIIDREGREIFERLKADRR